MLFKSIVKATLVATVFSQPVQHQHHHHEKRDVVTRTVYVTQGVKNDVSSATSVGTLTVSSAVLPVASSAASSLASGSFTAPVKGITYSPYNDDGSCKSATLVKAELQALSGYEIIRIYDVNCNQVENVLAAMSPNQKLFAGIYYMDKIPESVAALASAVKAANGWSQVHTVSIGNELVNVGTADVSQVQSYVEIGRAALIAAGYTGPVVAVDTFIAIRNNKGLCDLSDYIAANAHAYFDGGVTAENAGSWVSEQIQILTETCPNKKVLIVESGWPTRGKPNRLAIPGIDEQKTALNDLASKVSDEVFFFNAYNDMWKDPGYLDVEQYWGIYA